jgi:hypothetical protein
VPPWSEGCDHGTSTPAWKHQPHEALGPR